MLAKMTADFLPSAEVLRICVVRGCQLLCILESAVSHLGLTVAVENDLGFLKHGLKLVFVRSFCQCTPGRIFCLRGYKRLEIN